MPMLTERPEKIRSMVQVRDPFAPVRLAPVAVNGTSVPQVGVEILNDDGTWEAINIHSQGYQLIPNTLVQQAAREIMSRSDLEWSPTQTIWTGRFLSLMYHSDRIVDVLGVGDAGIQTLYGLDGLVAVALAANWTSAPLNGGEPTNLVRRIEVSSNSCLAWIRGLATIGQQSA